MKYLLDTHVFLWATGESKRLPKKVLTTLENAENVIHVSSITFWEIAIKVRTGKLALGRHEPDELPSRALEMGFGLIELSPDEAATMGQLAEDTHFDPFDRMLIWQAIQRGLTLISGDRQFREFENDGLKLLW